MYLLYAWGRGGCTWYKVPVKLREGTCSAPPELELQAIISLLNAFPDLNLDILKEEYVLLVTKSSLQPSNKSFLKKYLFMYYM